MNTNTICIHFPLVPAKAGTPSEIKSICYVTLDSRVRGNERRLVA